MGKTDKELAVELACAFINGWHNRPANDALEGKDIASLLKASYAALQSLPKEKDLDEGKS